MTQNLRHWLCSQTGAIVLFATLFFLQSCANDDNEIPPVYTGGKQGVEDEWKLVFEEEFEDSLWQWDIWYGGAYNEEIQLYTPEQLVLDNGILKINSIRKNTNGPRTNRDTNNQFFEYVSGRIESKFQFGPRDKFGEREYRFVSRLKIPSGHGMWPAFWTYGDPWPTQGEIDIIEARGGKPREYVSNLFYGINAGENINYNTSVTHQVNSDITANFHLYEMIWKRDSIYILFDNEVIHTWKDDVNNNIRRMFGRKQKIVFNTAVGGHFFEDRNSANYADSSFMEIDWVRVYKR